MLDKSYNHDLVLKSKANGVVARNGRKSQMVSTQDIQIYLASVGIFAPIAEIRPMYKVFLVIFEKGNHQRPRFVSKSVVAVEEPRAYSELLPLEQVQAAKTLSQLGKAIQDLSFKEGFKEWEFKLWTKNGECRLYVTDHSYKNPKQRGYIVIDQEGGKTYHWQRNKDQPKLPKLPKTKNDLLETKSTKDPVQRAISKLNVQFGQDNWSQADLDDELEKEEYCW